MPRKLRSLLLFCVLGLTACGGEGRPPVDPLELATSVLPRGRVGVSYAALLEARGGLAPILFMASDASVPPGLVLHGDGRLEGTPAEAGAFALSIGLEDARGDHARGSLTLAIDPEGPPEPLPLRLLTEALPAGDVGAPYAAVLEAADGTPPYTFGIAAGELPDGLALDAGAATIGGTPTEVGDNSVTVRVQDAAGQARERTLELSVSAPPDLVTELFPIGNVGEPYAAQLQVEDGAWPLTFEVYSGRLPDGLVLHPSGLVAGIPAAADSRPVRFRVTDAAGVTRDRRIRIWVVEDAVTEAWPNTAIPGNCGLDEPLVVSGVLRVDDPAMIARVQIAVDVDYEDMGMLEMSIVAPDGTRVLMHRGGGSVGGGIGLHFMFERDRLSWGSFQPLRGLGPAGLWTLEVRILPDPGYGCVAQPGRLQRFGVVIGAERSSEDYLRVHGYRPNNIIEGAFARITGGGLDQDELDLVAERWTTGANGIPEGGTGDDVLAEVVPLAWSTDLPAEVGAITAGGHFQSGSETGQGTLTGTAGELTLELPIKIVAPDWVP